ncbi:MAG TPA: hypothetical protein DEA08_13055 [Planctomycetes bacterium]|nr:hypothetical protein [Planctomycetota bacterium]
MKFRAQQLASLTLLPLGAGLLFLGCLGESDTNGNPPASSSQIGAVGSTAGVSSSTDFGPDHIGGLGSGQSNDTGDYVLENSFLRAVIDQPGTDPTSPGGAFPLVNGLAPSGGTLVDLQVRGKANDQWNQMTQGVVGFATIRQGTAAITTASNDRSRDLVFDLSADAFVQTLVTSAGATGGADGTNNAFADNTANFITSGVRGGDILTILSGANANRSYAISGLRNSTTLLLTVTSNTALTSEAGVSYRIHRQRLATGDSITFTGGANSGRSYRVAALGPLSTADGGTGSSAAIAIFRPAGVPFASEGTLAGGGSAGYRITRRTSPLQNLVVYDRAEIVGSGNPATLRLTGGILNQGGALPDGTSVAPTTSRLQVGSTAISVTTDYVLFPTTPYLQITSRLTHPGGSSIALSGLADVVVTGGFSPPNLAPWTPLAGYATRGLDSPLIVPFVGFRGRNTPPVSYAMADAQTGQMIHVADGQAVAANLQLSTRTSLASSETISWTRVIAVGDRNDVASAADVVVELLSASPVRTNPSGGTTIPNMYGDPIQLSGKVLGAPPGTTVTALQVTPALTFDAGVPNGLTPIAGFYPSTIVGAQELLVSSTEVDPGTGAFALTVPGSFAGKSPTASATTDLFFTSPYENGTSGTTYRVLVEAPGHDAQTVVVSIPQDVINNLQFDLRRETGTLDIVVQDEGGNPIPCQVLIRGVDPDGAGPAPTTPNPTFGGLVSSTSGQSANTANAFAAGNGTNTLYLLDGTAKVEVAPGFYQVVASRGLEYSLGRWPAPGSSVEYVRVASEQTTRTADSNNVGIRLVRLLDSDSLAFVGSGTTFTSPLRRLVGAELRGHTGASFDEPTPARDTLLQALALGLEVYVNTEHDNLLDLSGTLSALDAETSQNLSGLLRVQGGVELTPFLPVNVPNVAQFPNTVGSWSGFPISPQVNNRRNGAPADEFRNPAILIDTLRGRGASLVQINLPRAPIAAAPLPPIGPGFFTNGKAGFTQLNTGNAALAAGGYATPLRSNSTSTGNDGGMDDLNATRTGSTSRYNSFDLIELYAGNSTLYDITRTDFYALTSAGYVRTATGCADVTSTSGYPRTYVRTPGNGSADLANLSLSQFNANLLPSLVQANRGTTVPSLGNFFPATRRQGADADAMEVIVSSGPVVYIEVDANEDGVFEGQPGDLVTDDGDLSVNVRITVLAPPWVPVSQVNLLVNGGTPQINGTNVAPATGFGFQQIGITGTDLFSPSGFEVEYSTTLSNVVRVRTVRTVSLRNPPTFAVPNGSAGDHWIIGEARGTVTSGSLFNQLVPSLSGPAIGYTNPIFIDVNNDQEFDPPGVP